MAQMTVLEVLRRVPRIQSTSQMVAIVLFLVLMTQGMALTEPPREMPTFRG